MGPASAGMAPFGQAIAPGNRQPARHRRPGGRRRGRRSILRIARSALARRRRGPHPAGRDHSALLVPGPALGELLLLPVPPDRRHPPPALVPRLLDRGSRGHTASRRRRSAPLLLAPFEESKR